MRKVKVFMEFADTKGQYRSFDKVMMKHLLNWVGRLYIRKFLKRIEVLSVNE